MASQNANRTTIVVADDHVEIIKIIKNILSDDFEVVASAANGLAAIGAIAQFQPDVLITDIQMPMMDGIRAARHLRSMESTVKIIFISGSADPEVAQAAMSTNASGFVLKSHMAVDLPHALREALAGRHFISETVDAGISSLAPALPRSAAAETVTEQ